MRLNLPCVNVGAGSCLERSMAPMMWICVRRTPSTVIISRTTGVVRELPTRSRRSLALICADGAS